MPLNSFINGLFGYMTNERNLATQESINNQNIQFQQQANQQNFDFQREMTQTNFDNQVKMWNMANEYNHPAQQMARYREAGLNPNLIYGQSNTATTPSVATAHSASANAPKINPYYRNPIAVGNAAGEFISLLSQLEDLHMKKRENEIQDATKDQILLKYQFDNDYILSLIDKAKNESGNISQQTKNLITKNLLDSFDLSQTSTISKMNEYRLGIMANDFSMIPVYNDILKNQRDISNWDKKNAAWDYKSIRPMQYNMMAQELRNLKSQEKNLKDYGKLLGVQAIKTARDNTWLARTADGLMGIFGDILSLYGSSKYLKAARTGKWRSMDPYNGYNISY